MYRKYIKRILDICISLLTLPFVALSFVVVAPMIYLSDRGPVFYNAPRMGQHGKVFKMYKYRSMHKDSPLLKNADGSAYSGEDDPRVTGIGHIIRKLSIDEIPQFLNVLKGDMSIVGPRPTLALRAYETYDDNRKKRLEVKPGITGYSQAYFRNSVSQEQKLLNDCYYVDNVSFILDVKIVFQTAASVLRAKNINYKESSKAEELVR